MTKRSEVLAGTLGDAERGRMVIAMPGRRYFHQRDLARHGGHRAVFGQHAFARYTVRQRDTVRQRAVIRTLIRSDQGVPLPPV
jgi:hypothetical protein